MRNNYWHSEHPIGNPHITRKVQKGLPQRYYEPISTSLLIAGIAASVISTAVTVVSAISQGIAGKKAAKARANVAFRNAMTARANAAFDAEQARKVKFRRLGAIKAAGGASGIQFAGSVIDIFQSSIIEANIEIDNIKRKGEQRAQGFFDEASLQIAQGKNALTSGFFDAAGAVFSGIEGGISSFTASKRLGLLSTIAKNTSNIPEVGA